MSQKADPLESRDLCSTFDLYRDALDSLESLADFLYISSKELLAHADNLTKSILLEPSIEDSVPELGVENVREHVALASNRKKKCNSFLQD